MKTPLALLLTVLLAAPGRAAVIPITNTNDSGAGSLRQAVTDSNTAGGVNELSWGAGGTITLLTDLPAISGSAVLDVSSAPASVTIAGAGALPLNSAVSFHNDSLAQNLTVSAILNGTGGLVKSGTGQLLLTGVNTYTGGTRLSDGITAINADSGLGDSGGLLQMDGATLRTDAAVSMSRSVSLLAGGGTVDTNGFDSTLSGLIYGSGVLIKEGAGTLFITGAQAYSGGTLLNTGTVNINANDGLGSGAVTFNGGTLQTGAALSNRNAVLLNAPGGTLDTNAFDSVFTGVFSGAGALSKTGTGILDLTGANTYSGGTSITAGTLRINRADALGTGAVTINTATLGMNANLALTQAITLGAAGSTIDTGLYDVTLSGILSGAGGSLNKSGQGILTLSGASTYGGATAVNAGTLRLGADGALPAATNMTVAGAGTFDLGTHTQTVATYAGAGTLGVKLQSGVTNLTVAGNANFSGGTLSVALGPQLITEGQTFTLIAFGANAGSTQFSAIRSPAALAFTDSYLGGNVTLTASFVPFADSAATPNQSSVSRALENLRGNPSGDIGTVMAELYSFDAEQLRTALDQIAPRGLASMSGIGMAGASVQSAVVSQRMAVLAQGRGQGEASHYTVSRPSPFPGTLLAASGPMGARDSDAPKSKMSRLGFFAAGLGTVGRLTETYSAAGLQPGYAFNAGGMTTGVDYRLDDGLAIGAALGYIRGHASIYAPAAGTVDNLSYRFGVFAARHSEHARADIYLGGAADIFKTRRKIMFGGIERTATGSPYGTEFSVHPSGSFDIETARRGTFSPFAALDYNRMMIGSFTEKDAGALSLDVDQQTAQSLKSTLGIRFSGKYKGVHSAFIPYMALGWRHEYIDQSRRIGASFVAGGGDFSVLTGNYAKDGTMLGTGFSYDWSESTTIKADYAGDFRSHFQHNSLHASVRLKF